MPHVNATLPVAGMVKSTPTGWFRGRSRRMLSDGKMSCRPQPSSEVLVMVRRTGRPAGAVTLPGWYPVPSTVTESVDGAELAAVGVLS